MQLIVYIFITWISFFVSSKLYKKKYTKRKYLESESIIWQYNYNLSLLSFTAFKWNFNLSNHKPEITFSALEITF